MYLGQASFSRCRTEPLMGLRSRRSGRTTALEEAVRLHGGEGSAAAGDRIAALPITAPRCSRSLKELYVIHSGDPNAVQEPSPAEEVRPTPGREQDLEPDFRGVEPRDGRRKAPRTCGAQEEAEIQDQAWIQTRVEAQGHPLTVFSLLGGHLVGRDAFGPMARLGVGRSAKGHLVVWSHTTRRRISARAWGVRPARTLPTKKGFPPS
jgi:hypothetical protein